MPLNTLHPSNSWDSPESADGRTRAWRLYFTVYRELVSTLETEMERQCGFGLTWYELLSQLDEAVDGRMSMTELADAIVISKGGLTKLIDRMETAGLVSRRERPGDRRVNDIVMTERGRREFTRARTLHTASVGRHFVERISRSQAKAMTDALASVQDGLRRSG